ncbi:Ankyrin repeat family protein-like [Rhynchospora pubera]|uniref:Ankyrin repeat family protein-like n=1 Tax=Rhynchospora pubera TaxID=906938 RepID=A0AAV8CZB3_9POAL|nr:Ankyrin repeat family protein-like [Rhynchospora pubera]
MSVDLLANALRKASNLEDEDLCSFLRLAEGDERWKALLCDLCPPLDPARSGIDVQLFDDTQVMCPHMYQAALSGSINLVNELLGLTDGTTHDVTVVLEDSPEKRLRGKFHGDGLCTLQEVAAGKNTILHIAAEQGHYELVKQLISTDDSLLTFENSRHETPLHLAARAGKHNIISLFVLQAQQSLTRGAFEVLRRRNTDGDTVLHEAARNGHEATVQVLMTIAPALSTKGNTASISPLYLAVARNSVGVVEALLENKQASASGPKKQNALHAAVLRSSEITTMLLNWRPELAYERDSSGSTPLHFAASDGDVDMVQKILDIAPLAVYIQDEEGSSPLHVAARMCHYSTIDLIINWCPDSSKLRDNQGRNFIHIVAQHGRIKLSHYGFVQRIRLMYGLKQIAIFGKKINLEGHVLKKLVDERDNEGNTPLHCASMIGSVGMISELIQVKADTKVINNEGKTALDHSISQDSVFLMARSTIILFVHGATFGPQRQDKLKNWKDHEIIERTSKNLIVVCILIATIALSAAFNVPGSYNGDGLANLRRRKTYSLFLVFDTLSMSASVTAVMLLVVAKAVTEKGSRICFGISLILLWISLFTIEFAFVLGISVALGNGKMATKSLLYILPAFFFMFTAIIVNVLCLPTSLWTMRRVLSSKTGDRQTKRQIDIQFPTLTTYIRISSWFMILNVIFYLGLFGFLYGGSISYGIKHSWF